MTIVLGVDAALCNLGLAALELGPSSERVLELRVVRTAPARRTSGGAISDDARRVGELAVGMHAAVATHRPAAVVIEATGAGRGSKAVRGMALGFAVALTTAKLWNIPVVLVSPLDVKRAMTGRKKAEKDEIVLAAEQRYPDLEWPADVPEGAWEHAADAIGAVVAALPHERLRMLREGLCR